MKKFKTNKNEGAVSIIMSIMVLNILFVIGSGIAFLMFQQVKLSRQAGESVAAFYAADAGAEKCLYQIRKGIGTNCDTLGGGSNSDTINATYNISYVSSYNGVDTIISKGTRGEASRALQLSF